MVREIFVSSRDGSEWNEHFKMCPFDHAIVVYIGIKKKIEDLHKKTDKKKETKKNFGRKHKMFDKLSFLRGI